MIKIIQNTVDGKDISCFSKQSHKKILVECPVCKLQFEKEIRAIHKNNHTCCHSCIQKINGDKKFQKHMGTVFKDFTCISINEDRICNIECNICGNIKTMSINGFRKGVSHKQCGKDLNMRDTQFYSIWANMRTRTNNPNYEKWNRYGGRGINSNDFEYFADFYRIMYESYLEHVCIFGESQTTIDRINSDGNYCFNNCRWATWDEQADNKERNVEFKVIYPSGDVYRGKNLKKFCDTSDIDYNSIISQLSPKEIGEPYKNKKTGLVFIKEKLNDYRKHSSCREDMSEEASRAN